MDQVNVSGQQPNPAIEKQLADAFALLYQIVNAIDPDVGDVIPQRVETQLYRQYLDNQSAYIDARFAYTNAYREAQKTAIGRNTWPIVSSPLQLAVKTAHATWRAGAADQIEQAIKIIMNTPKVYFKSVV